MPTNKSTLKRMRTSVKSGMRNKARRSSLWTYEKNFRQAIEEGNVDSVLPMLAAMPITEEEALDMGRNRWRDQAYRNRMLFDWTQMVEQKYGAGALEMPVAELVLLGGSGCLMTILIVYLWWLKRRRGE